MTGLYGEELDRMLLVDAVEVYLAYVERQKTERRTFSQLAAAFVGTKPQEFDPWAWKGIIPRHRYFTSDQIRHRKRQRAERVSRQKGISLEEAGRLLGYEAGVLAPSKKGA